MPRQVVDASKIATEERLKELVSAVRILNGNVERTILDSLRMRLDDKTLKRQVATIQSFTKATDADIRNWLVNNMPLQYIDGLNAYRKPLGVVKVTLEEFKTNEAFLLHRNAVNLLIKDSYLDFGNTMVGVTRTSERTLSDAARRQVRAQIAGGEISGAAVRDIAKDIETGFEERGFTVFVNRAGTRWDLSRYSEMLARTALIKTANEGVVNRMREAGVDAVEWSTADSPCDICDPLDGQVFSESGDNPNLPPLKFAPPAHPNCRCALLPRPELDVDTSEEE